MTNPKVVLLIFSSGKIVLTGAKKREEIHEAYEKIKHLLKVHKTEEQRPAQPGYVEKIIKSDGSRVVRR